MSTSPLRRLVPAAVGFAALILVWQFYVELSDIRPQVLPSPVRVVDAGWAQRTVLTENAAATLKVTLVGFAVSLLVAWALAIAIDFSGMLRRALVPMFVTSQTIPIIVIAPLMITWFGFGLVPKVLLVALATFFPLVIGLIEGFASTEREAGSLLRSMGASRWKEFRFVRLPNALPQFFTALRIGITYAVVGAIFAEYAGAQHGLGVYMARQKQVFRTDLVLAAIVVTAVISIALFLLTYVVERLVAPWARLEREIR